ncbi:MAG TPA: EAL domain-containing protein [Thermoanaerobaculia bacterium]|nr:EAL domain-containing protein [Thermoanaerobaculia bacterium]
MTRELYGTLIAQGAGALILALLMRSFHRHYGKTYLQHWSGSWLAIAVAMLATAALPGLATAPPGAAPGMFVLRGVASYFHIALLIVGTVELARRRPARLRAMRRVMGAVAAAGVLVSAAVWFASEGWGQRESVSAAVRGLVGGIAFTTAAVLLFVRRAREGGMGYRLFAFALLLSGVHDLADFASGLRGRVAPLSAWLPYAELMLQSLLGLGMISSLLEDEREAAALASNEIAHMAYHDALTGLPNRPLFIDRLIVATAHAARHRQKLAVFFLDVDRFKEINDTLGHSPGDVLLKTLSDRIRKCVRAEDTVARFGGDEFTLLLQKIDRAEDAAKVAHKLLAAVKEPFIIGEHELYVSVSIGIALYPTDGLDAETLVKNADTAMYRAKDHGRDNYQIYAPAMNARALEKLALENLLRRALENKELELYYQPLIDLPGKKIYGAEALLRWHHPDHGLLSPYHFISTLESSGLIIPVGEWVLQEACRQTRLWCEQFDMRLSISVNLSARQFQQPDLTAQVRGALEASALPPELLELEITESNAMQNAEHSIRTLRELKALGIRMAVDDFGTGYSSLSYLKLFPIDTLKLDRSFVQDVTVDAGDAAIATAVISLARTLNLEMVAEGVETREQLNFFRDLGCHRLQGYLFSEPLPASKFEQFVREQASLPVLDHTEQEMR